MDKIRVLPNDVAQLIAAGEVVERPASVVKELVENAIDASATIITVDIAGGGCESIRVTDNGTGMTEQDAKNCFLRHATSKIGAADDIGRVMTLGFRGEALASIAAVSHVKLISRTAESVQGIQIDLQAGVISDLRPAGAPAGTDITVSDLFFNTPARKKFLKSERAETGAVSALMDKLALSHPEISFRYTANGKNELFTPGDGKSRSAAMAVLGAQETANMLEVAGKSAVRVTGLVSKPLAARGNRNRQYFFINGRTVLSPMLSKALESAYAGSLMTGKYPSCVLDIALEAGNVDVNVHPSKSIVKFSDERAVFNAVYGAVVGALSGEDQLHTTIKKTDMETSRAKDSSIRQSVVQPPLSGLSGAPQASDVSSQLPESSESPKTGAARTAPADGATPRGQNTSGNVPVCYRHRDWEEQGDRTVRFCDYNAPRAARTAPIAVPGMEGMQTADLGPAAVRPNRGGGIGETVSPVPAFSVRAEKDKFTQSGPGLETQIKPVGEIFNTYIVAQCDDEVYFIDKHAAHERLIFEKLATAGEGPVSQPLLVDCSVVLEREDKARILEELEYFTACGFEIEDYGANVIMVRSIPIELDREDIAAVIEQSVASLNDRRETKDKRTRILEVMACKAAVKAGQMNSPAEMNRLIERLFALPDVKYCPHGRPIVYTMTKKDFEKFFKRIV